jgi:fumarate hydratase class II
MSTEYRIEKDSMGELQVPIDVLYGAQTQRAVQNFPVSGLPMPRRFIRALALVKKCAAIVNGDLGHIPEPVAEAIIASAQKVMSEDMTRHFPVDVFQTGSGTSSNMNMNEVLAHMASADGVTVHPNDHVNYGQSSNDVIPTTLHVSAALAVKEQLQPSLEYLVTTLEAKIKEIGHITKTGRTHLMDAMPVTFAQELGGWIAQIKAIQQQLKHVLPGIHALAQGGTAVGTGINADPAFAPRFAKVISQSTEIPFTTDGNKFALISAQDAAVGLSGVLKTTAVALMKISNDLRWMNSGPLAGLSEIALPSLQPGSSIMPGKVNPVICESMMMVCAQVMGNDTTIMVSAQHGNFQLNVMLPVIALNLLSSIELLSNGMLMLSDKAIKEFEVNESHIGAQLDKNPILITALNAVIGYEKGAAIAKKAYAEKRPVLDVAKEMTTLSEAELKELLKPETLTQGGIIGG